MACLKQGQKNDEERVGLNEMKTAFFKKHIVWKIKTQGQMVNVTEVK